MSGAPQELSLAHETPLLFRVVCVFVFCVSLCVLVCVCVCVCVLHAAMVHGKHSRSSTAPAG